MCRPYAGASDGPCVHAQRQSGALRFRTQEDKSDQPADQRHHAADREAVAVPFRSRCRAFDHAAHDVGRDDARRCADGAVDRQNRATLRGRRDLAKDGRRENVDDRRKRRSCDDQGHCRCHIRRKGARKQSQAAETYGNAADDTSRHAARGSRLHHALRQPAAADHNEEAGDERQRGQLARQRLLEAKSLHEVRREPGQHQRQAEIRTEIRAPGRQIRSGSAKDRDRECARSTTAPSATARLFDAAFLAKQRPRGDPGKTDDA